MMTFLATSGATSLQEIGNKIISVGMPILIGLAITIGIVEQKKKAKKIAQKFNQIILWNLVKLNKNFGLIKSNLSQHTILVDNYW
ncbi:hypothetical protein [Spiroplasma sp. Moj]|uniref:hypothetical protein n=1 Tax=Spiroplasma sp. Moj TaxID=1922342 RepID=UPI0039F0492D|nr:hypothetical protein [Spiroplasma sp. Moj]